MITVKNINKSFFRGKKNELQVLKDVSYTFAKTGFITLLGKSGSGKTTLLNVISGLDKPNDGAITFLDQTFKHYHPKRWAKIRTTAIGFVFQNYYLLPQLSVFDNVALSLKLLGITDKTEIKNRVEYVLKQVGMYTYRRKKGLQLSGGQQQRVALARALVKNPRVLICDEPTGNLDSKNTQEIMNILRKIAHQKLVVMVTHEQELAQLYSDQILYLKDGQITDIKKNLVQNDTHTNNDDCLYLKDFSVQEKLSKQNLALKFYSDHKISNLDITLIFKNNTLYVATKNHDQSLKLLKDSGLKTIDSHYQKPSIKEQQQTAFDTEKLAIKDHVFREQPLLTSFKQAIKSAVIHLLNYGRRGKMMLFFFFVSGSLIAAAFSLFNIFDTSAYKELMQTPEPIETIERQVFWTEDQSSQTAPTHFAQNDLLNFVPQTEQLHFDLYYGKQTTQAPALSRSKVYPQRFYLNEPPLKEGRWPQASHEIVISSKYLSSTLASDKAARAGIWKKEQFFHNDFQLDSYPEKLQIVGVIQDEIDYLIVPDTLYTYIFYQKSTLANAFMPYSLASTNTDWCQNVSINVNEQTDFLIHQALAEQLSVTTFPHLLPNGYRLVGSFCGPTVNFVSYQPMPAVIPTETLGLQFSSPNCYIASSDVNSELLETLDGTHIHYVDNVEEAQNEVALMRSQTIAALGVIFTLILVITFLSYGFTMRSRLSTRIYNIAVFRSLGLSRRNITFSFFMEIIFLTSTSALLGYLFGLFFVHQINSTLIGEFNLLAITPLSVVSGLLTLYGLAIVAGMIPIWLFLKKTPAQMLTNYDL